MKMIPCFLLFVIVVLTSNAQQTYDTIQERLKIYKIEHFEPKNEIFYYAKNNQGKRYIVIDIMNRCLIKKGIYNCHCITPHKDKKIMLGSPQLITIKDMNYYIPELLPLDGEISFFIDCPQRSK